MDAAKIQGVMALIPERIARVQSGAAFTLQDHCRYPERMEFLAQRLHWMTPLETLGKEQQQLLGLLNAAGRPVHAAELEEEADGEADLECAAGDEPACLADEPAPLAEEPILPAALPVPAAEERVAEAALA